MIKFQWQSQTNEPDGGTDIATLVRGALAEVRTVPVLLVMAALCNRGPLYFCPVVSFYLLSIFYLSFFSSPNLSGHRLDVYHTSTHGVALVRI